MTSWIQKTCRGRSLPSCTLTLKQDRLCQQDKSPCRTSEQLARSSTSLLLNRKKQQQKLLTLALLLQQSLQRHQLP